MAQAEPERAKALFRAFRAWLHARPGSELLAYRMQHKSLPGGIFQTAAGDFAAHDRWLVQADDWLSILPNGAAGGPKLRSKATTEPGQPDVKCAETAVNSNRGSRYQVLRDKALAVPCARVQRFLQHVVSPNTFSMLFACREKLCDLKENFCPNELEPSKDDKRQLIELVNTQ